MNTLIPLDAQCLSFLNLPYSKKEERTRKAGKKERWTEGQVLAPQVIPSSSKARGPNCVHVNALTWVFAYVIASRTQNLFHWSWQHPWSRDSTPGGLELCHDCTLAQLSLCMTSSFAIANHLAGPESSNPIFQASSRFSDLSVPL